VRSRLPDERRLPLANCSTVAVFSFGDGFRLTSDLATNRAFCILRERMRRVFASSLPGDAELARSLLANYGIEAYLVGIGVAPPEEWSASPAVWVAREHRDREYFGDRSSFARHRELPLGSGPVARLSACWRIWGARHRRPPHDREGARYSDRLHHPDGELQLATHRRELDLQQLVRRVPQEGRKVVRSKA